MVLSEPASPSGAATSRANLPRPQGLGPARNPLKTMSEIAAEAPVPGRAAAPTAADGPAPAASLAADRAAQIVWQWRRTPAADERAQAAAAARRKGLLGGAVGLAVATALYFWKPQMALVVVAIAVATTLLALEVEEAAAGGTGSDALAAEQTLATSRGGGLRALVGRRSAAPLPNDLRCAVGRPQSGRAWAVAASRSGSGARDLRGLGSDFARGFQWVPSRARTQRARVVISPEDLLTNLEIADALDRLADQVSVLRETRSRSRLPPRRA